MRVARQSRSHRILEFRHARRTRCWSTFPDEFEVFDMRYIDEMGMRHTMEQALMGMDENTHLHVSFDVDFLDPEIAPGVGTTVPGGPTYREAQLCMEMIADTGRLASMDVMELNPALDVRNRTAELAVDLIESLFGKSTLMRKK
jgi:arginase